VDIFTEQKVLIRYFLVPEQGPENSLSVELGRLFSIGQFGKIIHPLLSWSSLLLDSLFDIVSNGIPPEG
jgi:hypothetical protein